MALSLCESRPGPLTRLLRAAIINRDLPRDGLEAVLNANVELESLRLNKRLRSLAFIGSIAVIIGLLGTIVGVFVSIAAMMRGSEIDATSRVAGGISSALLTTAGGLVVALPAMVGYAYFTAKANSMADEVTRHSLSLLRFFTTGSSQLVEQEAEQSDE